MSSWLLFFLHLVLIFEILESTESVDLTTRFYARTCESDLVAGEVLHAYETRNFGCLLKCSILSASSEKSKEFLDHYDLQTHYLSGRECINQTYVCINGTCVINPLKMDPLAISLVPYPGDDNEVRVVVTRQPTSGHSGNVSVKFAGAHVDVMDNFFNKADPYVKFFVNTRMIGRTATKKDTHYPLFNENFYVNSLTRMDILKFEVWNENSSKDDYIFSITTSCDEVITKRLNQKKRKHYSGLVNHLSLTISCGGF